MSPMIPIEAPIGVFIFRSIHKKSSTEDVLLLLGRQEKFFLYGNNLNNCSAEQLEE